MRTVASFLYQWIVFIPLFLLLTLITALVVIIMAPLFGSRFWGYQPPKWWSRFTCWLALCRIQTSGHEYLDPEQSYVFVANHQSAFDIFLVYGFLRHPIIWMQKKSLRTIPFVGFASEKAGHVFVDNSSVASRAATIEKAKESITSGISMVIFPEGARTRSGKMGRFKRGAFQIAYDMKLPIVPLTLNGPYEVLKRNSLRLSLGKLMELIIHPPIQTDNLSRDELPGLMEKTREIIHGSLWERYR
ncbi:MAG: lysophospholipid acyltransferase family protein [Fermentimonas sp.]|jgi:1-acyl-sn-glycerol-3-phosphate acyltransferase